jgi:hypothetical protein
MIWLVSELPPQFRTSKKVSCTKIRKTRKGQRIRPLKEATIRTRQAEIQAAARMAVKPIFYTSSGGM